jgi:hypothetical protein
MLRHRMNGDLAPAVPRFVLQMKAGVAHECIVRQILREPPPPKASPRNDTGSSSIVDLPCGGNADLFFRWSLRVGDVSLSGKKERQRVGGQE